MGLIKKLLDQIDEKSKIDQIKNQKDEKFEKIFIQVPSNHGKMIEFLKFLGFEIDRILNRTYTKRDEVMVQVPDMNYALGAL